MMIEQEQDGVKVSKAVEVDKAVKVVKAVVVGIGKA